MVSLASTRIQPKNLVKRNQILAAPRKIIDSLKMTSGLPEVRWETWKESWSFERQTWDERWSAYKPEAKEETKIEFTNPSVIFIWI